MQLRLFYSFILITFLSASDAQAQFNWPENAEARKTAETKNVLYTDDLKQENFKTAIGPHRWLLENTPDLNKSIYINGAKIYEAMVEATPAGNQRNNYEDSALIMYDLRIKHFGEEANVLNRKGLKAYAYWVDRPDKTPELYTLYAKIIELNGAETYTANLAFYMGALCQAKAAGTVDEDKVITEYEKISIMLDREMMEASNKGYVIQIKESVDKAFAACVTVDCKFIVAKMGPKYREAPDLETAKKILGLMVNGKCTDDPLFMEVNEFILAKEPTFGGYKVQALKYRSDKNYDKAIENYEKAAEYAENADDKADVYYEIAKIKSNSGSKAAARTYANKALAAKPGWGAPLEMIGDLYFKSASDCSGKNVIYDRAVYLAAYDKYQAAGATSKMSQAQAQFPSVEDIFNYGDGLKKGQVIQTGCWVNESTELRTRD